MDFFQYIDGLVNLLLFCRDKNYRQARDQFLAHRKRLKSSA